MLFNIHQIQKDCIGVYRRYNMKKCKVGGCRNGLKFGAFGMCQKHYRRYKKYGTPHVEIIGGVNTGMSPYDRIMKKIMVGDKNKCWEWNGNLEVGGYGVIRKNFKKGVLRVHRVVLEHKLGRKIKKGMFACHTCDNRKCVNPEHLYEGTHQDNMNDLVLRSRGRYNYGEKRTNATLANSDVKFIRYIYNKYHVWGKKGQWCSHRFLADFFNTNQTTIHFVLNNLSYVNI